MEDTNLIYYLLLERILIKEYSLEFGSYGTLSAQPTSDKARGLLLSRLVETFPWLSTICERQTFLLLLRASNFDLLSFACYYSSSLYRAGRHVAPLDEAGMAALGLDQAIIWARHSRLDTDGLCFNMKRKSRRSDDPQIVHSKSEQVLEFQEAVRALLVASGKSRKEIIELGSATRREGEQYWWSSLRFTGVWKDVSQTHRDTLYQACVVIATMLENMFSEPKRFKRLLAVHRKLPQSFITTSLYMINPAPFISKIIPMYVWKPSAGTWSLCQRMGSSICGVSKTQASLDSLHLDEAFKEKVHRICASKTDILSCESDQVYEQILKDSNIVAPTKQQVEYLKLSFRMREKMDFVNHLGDHGESPFLKMCSELLPPLLNELAKVGKLHDIVSSFFDLLNKFWASLEKYHLNPVPPSRKEMVLELADHFHKFVEWFFPMLYKVALKSGTKEELPILTILFDCLFGSLMGWNAGPSTTTFHEDLHKFINSDLKESERESLNNWVKSVCDLAVLQARDESEWPANDIVDEKLVPTAIDGYINLIRNLTQ